MSDLAEGSTAVRQLQQNVAAAPYVQDLTQAASERKIQEDRLAAQYAPQIAAAKAEEEQMRLQTVRLQKLTSENQYKADTESTAKLQQWLQTDDGKKASDLDITKKSASLKMQAGLTEQGAKLYERAEKIEATELANQTKQLAQDNETIAKAAVVLDAVPSEKVDEFFGRLPEEQKKLILKQVGEDNWNKATGEEKKKIVDRLFLNAKGQLIEQIKAVELKKTELVTKNKLEIENSKEAAAKVLQTMKGDTAVEVQEKKSETTLEAQRIKDEAALERVKQKGADDLERQRKKDEDAMERLKASNASKKEIEELREKSKKEIEQLRDKTKKEIEDMKEKASKAKSDKKDDVKDATFYIKEHDKIVKSGEKQEQVLQEKVNATQKLFEESKTASWYEPKAYKEDKRSKAYTDAVNELNKFRKQQTQREIETFENAPDFPKKQEILRKLKQTLAAVDTPPMDKEPPPAKAEAPKAAPAKDVPSNKYTQDNPAKPTSKEEYDKLPPNSYYIQDGVVKRKKG
jgi:choline dehydrogenase-like flavoprotein